MSQWVEIRVPARSSEAEDIAALLALQISAAKSGTEIRAGEIIFWVSADVAENLLKETRAAVESLVGRGFHLSSDRVYSHAAVPEEEWRNAWKKYFHATRLTRQLVIVPSWETYESVEGDRVIDLDPGQAFGTGCHASTQLVLEAMQDLHDQGLSFDRFLDVGCGTGILSIAATLFWAGSSGIAIDTDPIAVEATEENSQINRCKGQIACSTTPIGEIQEMFPLALANIQAHILLAMIDDLGPRVASGGYLIMSGLLTKQAPSIASAYANKIGFDILHLSNPQGEWSSAILRRK